jgi:hypothetical protein
MTPTVTPVTVGVMCRETAAEAPPPAQAPIPFGFVALLAILLNVAAVAVLRRRAAA